MQKKLFSFIQKNSSFLLNDLVYSILCLWIKNTPTGSSAEI